VADFRSRVPINTYDTLAPYVQRMLRGEHQILTRSDPLMFGVTSGTTASAKFLPVTPEYLAEYTASVRVHLLRGEHRVSGQAGEPASRAAGALHAGARQLRSLPPGARL